MTASAITSNPTTTPATNSIDSITGSSSTLNQANFLQLLVAQIQYQDPMNPQSDTAMAAQLAQFSSLQQSTQSASSLSMMQANSLVGSTVGIQVDSNTTTTGVVMSNGAPQITVGGRNYGLSQVNSVTPPLNSTTPATPSPQTTQ
jgi:flagellar basal-body rod modification protein FlgD